METAGIFDLPQIRFLGRCHPISARRSGALPLLWAGSGLELCFTGSELHLLAEADFSALEPWLAVELNGAPLLRMPLERGIQEICLFRGMAPGTPKRVRVFKETQPMGGDPAHRLRVRGLVWEGGGFLPVPAPACRLEFVGDSLTSGEGVVGAREETDWISALFSASRTWAKRTADLLGADFRLISQSGWGVRSGWDNDPAHTLPSIYDRVCAPASGGENQALHDFRSWQPDAVIVNLGTNDASAMSGPPWRGPEGRVFRQTGDAAGLALFEDAVVDFLGTLRRHNPAARLVWVYGMLGGPLGPCLAEAVARFCRETGDRNAYYLPLPAVTEETMGSRQHPGPLCHQAAAEAAAEFLRSIL